MWKREEEKTPQPTYSPPATNSSELKERATIGPSIFVKGDLSGDEDLIVQGRVEGTIKLSDNNVTVGNQGRVKADVRARIISVEGQVEGNLFAQEKIVIRKSGRVKGNLVAPRVSLEDGSTFKGSIDMEVSAQPDVKQAETKKNQPAATMTGTGAPENAPLRLRADPAGSRVK